MHYSAYEALMLKLWLFEIAYRAVLFYNSQASFQDKLQGQEIIFRIVGNCYTLHANTYINWSIYFIKKFFYLNIVVKSFDVNWDLGKVSQVIIC